MALPNRITAVVSKIPDQQTRDAVWRFLNRWQHEQKVFTGGYLNRAHTYPPPTRIALRLSQVPGADLASWAFDMTGTCLDWLVESFARMYKKSGQINPSVRKQCEFVLKKGHH